jgi:hypothetical protein
VNLGGICSQTADCQPNLHCDDGKCAEIKEVGEECSNESQCGRRNVCHFSDPDSLYGTCKPMFSVKNGADTNVMNHFMNGKLKMFGPYSHLMCVSGYASVDGICSAGPVSENRGVACETDYDCPSNDPSDIAYATCTCVIGDPSVAPASYCGLLPGDGEWVEARRLVQFSFIIF